MRVLANTDHHPVGTCRMGPPADAMAVVDSRLRVRGGCLGPERHGGTLKTEPFSPFSTYVENS